MLVNVDPVAPDAAVELVLYALSEGWTPMLFGGIGIGKTEIVEELGRTRFDGVVHLDLSLSEASDLRGLPLVDAGAGLTRWLAPEELTRPGRRLLFLDDLTNADERLQAAAYRLILQRAVGDRRLPDGYEVVAAGNRPVDGHIVRAMPGGVANRLFHIQVAPSAAQWAGWGSRTGRVPPEVLGYVRVHEDALHDEKALAESVACPTPRTWERVGRCLLALRSGRIGDAVFRRAVAGHVGRERAAHFLAWLKANEAAATVAAILAAKPDRRAALLPDDLGGLHTLGYALAAFARTEPGRATDALGLAVGLSAAKRWPESLPIAEMQTAIVEMALAPLLEAGREDAALAVPGVREHLARRSGTGRRG